MLPYGDDSSQSEVDHSSDPSLPLRAASLHPQVLSVYRFNKNPHCNSCYAARAFWFGQCTPPPPPTPSTSL